MVYEAYVLIGTILFFLFAAENVYLLVDRFCNFVGERVEKLFKKTTDDGKKLLGVAAFAFIGIGKATRILNTSPTISLYFCVLTVVGFLAFFFAPLVARSRTLSVVYSFVAVTCHLAIMGLCSTYFVSSDTFAHVVVVLSPLYLLLMIFLRSLTHNMGKLLGLAPLPQASEPDQTKDEKTLESLAKQGVAYTTTTGIALLAAGVFGDHIEHSPTLIWLAWYNLGAFWVFQGAVFLERGCLFHLWVVLGLIMSLAMFLTGFAFVFLPTYEPLLLFISVGVVILHLEWDWIEENVIDWYLGVHPPCHKPTTVEAQLNEASKEC